MDVAEASRLITKRVDDYRPQLPDLQLRLVRTKEYYETVRRDPDIAEQVALGLIEDVETEVKTPVLATLTLHLLTACPELIVKKLVGEPPSLHRPYVDGAILRQLLLFFAEDGRQGPVQVRAVM